MSVDDLESVLLRLGACQPALQWLRASGCRTFAEAWEACPRGSWLAWLVLALSLDVQPGDTLWDVARRRAPQFCESGLPHMALQYAEEAVPARMRDDERRTMADAVRTIIDADVVEVELRYEMGRT